MVWFYVVFTSLLLLTVIGFVRDLWPYGIASISGVLGPLIIGATVALIRTAVTGARGAPLLNVISLFLGSLLIATLGHPTRIVDREILNGLPGFNTTASKVPEYNTSRCQWTFIGLFVSSLFVLGSVFPNQF